MISQKITKFEPVKIRATLKSLKKRGDTLVYEAKLDGSRYLLYKIGDDLKLLGRNKSKVTGEYLNKIDNVPHIKKWAANIEEDFILDGEIWHPGGFGTCAGIMNSKPDRAHIIQSEKGRLNYYIFDLLLYNDKDLRKLPYSKRRDRLREFRQNNKEEWLFLTPIIGTSDTADIKSAFKEAINLGWEGIVVKTFSGKYRSSEWAKKKAEKTYDYIITGFIDSDSDKYKGNGVAAICLALYDGFKLVEVMKCSGMSDEWKQEFYNNRKKYIGKVVEVKGQEMFDTGALRHPNFIRIRDDIPPEEQTFQKYGLRKGQNRIEI